MQTPAGFMAFHLADSAFPTGGYAFSSGIEAAAKLGLFRTRTEFVSYLRNALDQLTHYEVPFLQSFCRNPELPDLVEIYHAGCLVPTMSKASLIQGRSLLRALENIHGPAAVDGANARLSRDPERRHFVPVFGFCLTDLGLSVTEITHCFFYINLRDWISSAVRLGSVGPMEGHRIQHELLQEIPALQQAIADKTWEDARRCAPLLDAAQAWHQYIYSKLFQS